MRPDPLLTRLVERFERRLDSPHLLDPADAPSDETRRNVIAALREEGPYRHPDLADEMEHELDENG